MAMGLVLMAGGRETGCSVQEEQSFRKHWSVEVVQWDFDRIMC